MHASGVKKMIAVNTIGSGSQEQIFSLLKLPLAEQQAAIQGLLSLFSSSTGYEALANGNGMLKITPGVER